MNELEQQLLKYRDKIDTIDNNILDLLEKRIDVVQEVGRLKTSHTNGNSFIRPGREAIMLRRISDRFDDRISKASVAQMWRIIISSAINIEENTCVSTLFLSGNEECYWLAREYFGTFTKMNQKPTIMEVLRDLYSKDATVGVIPIDDENSARPWWSRICDEENKPRIFAKLPFIQLAESQKSPLFALGYVDPEPTGHDESIWIIQAEERASLSSLQEVLEQLNIPYEYQATCRILDNPNYHHYLIKLNGFFNEESEKMTEFVKIANEKCITDIIPISTHYLGSYAIPLMFD